MTNSLSPASLAARSTAIVRALGTCVPDFCPSGSKGAAR